MNSLIALIKHPLIKRKIIAVLLGIFFGFLCCFIASFNNPLIRGSSLMWAIIYNRMLIGVFIFLFGIINYHPLFKFPITWRFRGPIIGFVVSMDLAIGALIYPEANSVFIFWSTIVAGLVYGTIIDFFATKYAGEGKCLIDGFSK